MALGTADQKDSASWKNRIYQAYVSSGQATRSLGCQDTRDPKQFFAPRAAHIRGVISKHIKCSPDARILDLACGHGAYLYFLRSVGYSNAAGVDVSSEQVALARELGIDAVECGDVLSYLRNQRTASVGVVLIIDLLEHLAPRELFEILDEVLRVLRVGGTCIAHVPNGEGLYGMRVRYGDLTHERCFVPRSAEQLFRAIGFSDVICFEDRPGMQSFKRMVRHVLWRIGTIPHRLLLTVETGTTGFVLSQNMLVTARKGETAYSDPSRNDHRK